MYDDAGCYNCDSPWARKAVTGVSKAVSGFSVFNKVWTRYEKYTTGKTSHKSRQAVPQYVRDMVAGAWPGVKTTVVNVCDNCPVPPAGPAYTPCEDEVNYMMNWCYDYADWDMAGQNGPQPADPY